MIGCLSYTVKSNLLQLKKWPSLNIQIKSEKEKRKTVCPSDTTDVTLNKDDILYIL